jgi:hypothetical protein
MLFFAGAAIGVAEATLLSHRAYLEASQNCAFIPYRMGQLPAILPAPQTHRCAYCRTLDSASVRCPSCGAPR